jgi:hypothetical protein
VFGGVRMTFPEIALASPRKHNEFVRAELQDALDAHHREVMPEHFKQSAATRYQHAKRTPAWIKYKIRKFRTGTDLIASGKTKAEVLGPGRRITVSGSAAQDTLRGRLTMRLPFGGGTGAGTDAAMYERLQEALDRGTDKRGRPLSIDERLTIERRLRNQFNNRGKTGVTPEQMVRELRTVTNDETDKMTRRIGAGYIARIRSMKRPHLRFGATI